MESAASEIVEANSSSKKSVIKLWTYKWKDAPKVYGLEDDLVSLEIILNQRDQENEFKAIGVVGMPGVGKTTLCHQLVSKPELKSHFLVMIWVCMSREPTSHEEEEEEEGRTNVFKKDKEVRKLIILKRMLEYLGVEVDNNNNNNGQEVSDCEKLKAFLYLLHLHLKGKRYLIVLDDAQDKDEWYKDLDASGPTSTRDDSWGTCLGHGLPKGCGGTVIVISRNEEVVKNMVGENRNIHRLMPFTDLESFWLIFKDSYEKEYANELFNDPRVTSARLRNMKELLMKRCGGIPLAAKLMGRRRSEESKEELQLQHAKSQPEPLFPKEASKIAHTNSESDIIGLYADHKSPNEIYDHTVIN